MTKRRVQELMNPDVVCLEPGMTVGEAERVLATRHVGGAPVVETTAFTPQEFVLLYVIMEVGVCEGEYIPPE